MFLEAELVMLHDICQPTNSFRGLCGLSEQTESSATPSVGSLFGRPYEKAQKLLGFHQL